MRAAAAGMAALGIGADVAPDQPADPLPPDRRASSASGSASSPSRPAACAPGMDLDELDDALLRYAGAAAVMVCGHEPDLSEAVADLTGGGLVEFRKGSLALLDVAAVRPAGGRLRALYPPSALRRLGAA